MSDIAGKVVAITGASSGIGAATARHLAGKGAHVVVGARRTDRLDQLVADLTGSGAQALARRLDVANRADVEAFVASAVDRFGRLDVMVNNAGLMPLSHLAQLKVEEWDRMIDVNIRGVLYGIAAALPVMQRQKSGHVINVSSTAGHRIIPGAAVYSGTKFAVRAISEGLRQEIGEDIRVTIISPGVVTSELAETISDPDTKKRIDDFRKTAIAPEAIARAIAYAIEQPRDVDVNEILIRPTAQAS